MQLAAYFYRRITYGQCTDLPRVQVGLHCAGLSCGGTRTDPLDCKHSSAMCSACMGTGAFMNIRFCEVLGLEQVDIEMLYLPVDRLVHIRSLLALQDSMFGAATGLQALPEVCRPTGGLSSIFSHNHDHRIQSHINRVYRPGQPYTMLVSEKLSVFREKLLTARALRIPGAKIAEI